MVKVWTLERRWSSRKSWNIRRNADPGKWIFISKCKRKHIILSNDMQY